MLRIVDDIRPKYVFMENSPVFIRHGSALVAGVLSAMGYASSVGRLGASDIGGSHHRKRAWLLANSGEVGLSRVGPQKQKNEYTTESFLILDQTPRPGAQRDIPRMVDDVAHWVDRLKAIGNGQIPAVVKLAWETLMP